MNAHHYTPSIVYLKFFKAAGIGRHLDAAENIFRSIKRVVHPTEHTYKHIMGANIKAARCCI